ncbi:MAG: hypothetical protein QOE77_3336 [Blastocatellia bacterium]|jgi:hypothetical protein|nr:hypothetical protein [Blastocatellia bacterium]
MPFPLVREPDEDGQRAKASRDPNQGTVELWGLKVLRGRLSS